MIRSRLIICVAMLINRCFAVDCILPKFHSQINWDRLPGTWYETFNAHDPVASVAPCEVLKNIRSDGNGGAYIEIEAITNISGSAVTYNAIPQHSVRQPDGNYLFDTEYQRILYDETNSLAKKKHAGPMKKSINKEVNSAFHDPFVVSTDYENYYLVVMCTKDAKYVWVYGRNSYATDNDVEIFRKELARFGNGWENVPLYRAGCSNFQFSYRSLQ